jgi:hypothetical protein
MLDEVTVSLFPEHREAGVVEMLGVICGNQCFKVWAIPMQESREHGLDEASVGVSPM